MRTERPAWVYDDTFATGSFAAAFGGVTTFIDQAQVEPGTTLVDGLESGWPRPRRVVVDYGIHVNLREASGERIAEIPEIVARGCPSLKLFMAYEEFRLPIRSSSRHAGARPGRRQRHRGTPRTRT